MNANKNNESVVVSVHKILTNIIDSTHSFAEKQDRIKLKEKLRTSSVMRVLQSFIIFLHCSGVYWKSDADLQNDRGVFSCLLLFLWRLTGKNNSLNKTYTMHSIIWWRAKKDESIQNSLHKYMNLPVKYRILKYKYAHLSIKIKEYLSATVLNMFV